MSDYMQEAGVLILRLCSAVNDGRTHDAALIQTALLAHIERGRVPEGWRDDVHLAAQMLTWGHSDGEGMTARQEDEVRQHQKKLFAMLAAAPAAPDHSDEDSRIAALFDSQFAAGMLLGWNLATDGRQDEFNSIREGRMRGACSQLKRVAVAAPDHAALTADRLWPMDGLYPDMLPPATQKERWMFDQGRLAERRIAQEAAEVPMPEPRAWEVWWGLGNMRPHGPVFRTKAEADAVAALIKSTTEVRPLFGDAREAAGYSRAKKVAQTGLSSAAVDVLAERQRQISAEGWTPEHDDEHSQGEMSRAAACYAHCSHDDVRTKIFLCPRGWPWAPSWWKPSTPRRDLVKAGALILAEIERLDRAAQKGGE